jgi:hypothetical protein
MFPSLKRFIPKKVWEDEFIETLFGGIIWVICCKLTEKRYKISNMPPEKYRRAKMLSGGAVANMNCCPSKTKPKKKENFKNNETENI